MDDSRNGLRINSKYKDHLAVNKTEHVSWCLLFGCAVFGGQGGLLLRQRVAHERISGGQDKIEVWWAPDGQDNSRCGGHLVDRLTQGVSARRDTAVQQLNKLPFADRLQAHRVHAGQNPDNCVCVCDSCVTPAAGSVRRYGT